jgi:hypothetical protein
VLSLLARVRKYARWCTCPVCGYRALAYGHSFCPRCDDRELRIEGALLCGEPERIDEILADKYC